MQSVLEKHYVNRSNWLRAAILGANDGLLSTSGIAIGVAAASSEKSHLIIAALAGLVAGAFSMAAGEYISVSSQEDIEKSDLKREKNELEKMPETELNELAKIYSERGLNNETAIEVAKQLTAHNALEAHARDELGINEISQAKPLQAAFASALSFISGSLLPVIVVFIFPMNYMVYAQYIFTIIFLIILGAIAAKLGGSDIKKGILRISFWGTVAMLMSAFIGYLFGINIK